MANWTLDCLGFKCPQPSLKVSVAATRLQPGDTLEVIADCPSFEKDLRDWAGRARKTLLWIRDEGGGKKRAQIRI